MLQSNSTQKRVFIVGNDSLFDEGVMQLLTQQTNFLVSRAKFSDDDTAFLKTIKRDCPDVVLVCESDSLDVARILDLLSLHLTMLILFVIVIRLYNTAIDVYEKPNIIAGKMNYLSQQIMVTTIDDLLNVIRRK